MNDFQLLIDLINVWGEANGKVDFITDANTEETEEMEGISAGLFLTNKGTPNYSEMAKFTELSGWEIGPGETDSFGWLTGVIYTPYGKLVWG